MAQTSKAVGIWIRVSTEDQASGESPEHHEMRARYYAESKDWKVVRVYDLSAVSGKRVMGHPEAQAMLRDVRDGRIEGLIFSKLARLARNTKELIEFAEFFKEHGADLISLAESIDTSSPAGRFFYTLLAAMAQWEREEISDRVKASVVVRGKLGKSLGGAPPFGYRLVDRKLALDEQEAPIRRELFEVFARERRIKTVARHLNAHGYRTRRGTKFSSTTVRRLLENPIAKGKRCVNTIDTSGASKPEDEWIWVDAPRIVSDELWEECNALLRTHTRPAKQARHLFTGVAICMCGNKMYVPSKSKKYTCVSCKNKIPVDTLEAIFQSKLSSFLSSPEDMRAAFADSDVELQRQQELLDAATREVATVTKEMDKLYRLYQDDGISRAGFKERYQPLEERQGQLRAELPRLEAQIDVLRVRNLSSSEIVDEAASLYRRWHELPFKDRRAIVEAVVSQITVGTEDVAIDLISSTRPPPDPEGLLLLSQEDVTNGYRTVADLPSKKSLGGRSVADSPSR